MKKLYNYDWPGNIREVKHCIEQSVILSEKQLIDVNDIILERLVDEKKISDKEIDDINQMEKRLIINALKKVEGNKTSAANLLGLTRSALRYRIEKYKIEEGSN